MPAQGVPAHRANMPRVSGNSIDGQVTSKYIAAVQTSLRSIENSMRSVDRTIGQVVMSVSNQCPNVVAGAPINLSRWRVEMGITEIVAIAAAHADMRIISRLRSRVKRMHWRNPRVTALIQRRVRTMSMETRLREPRLCNYLQEWAHSRFLLVPPGLTKFSHNADVLAKAGDLLPSVLEKYENQDKRKTVREMRGVQLAVGRELRTHVLDGRMEIYRVIGLRHGNAADRGRSRPIRSQTTGSGYSCTPRF
jgi:hypothetical protein